MANSRYKFFDDVWNDYINHYQKGFLIENFRDILNSDNDILYTIPLEYQYRPDLIANKFYGNPKLYWVLVYSNNFSRCPEDFETGVIIRVPRYEKVVSLI